MTILNPKTKKKLEEIIGDSTGVEAAQKIAEWFQENTKYEHYEVPPRCGKTFKQELEFERRKALNCSDSNGANKYKERRRLHKKMQELKEMKQ